LRRHYPIATFCAGWTFLVLSVTSIVPLLDAAFEYRVYLPVAALAWLTAAAGADLAAWAAPRIGRWGWWAAAGAVLAWAGALGALTVARNRVYQDPLTLHADTVAKAPASARAQYDYGNALMKQRRYAEAMEAFRAALRADPARSDARIHLALLLKRAGRYDEAEAELKAAAAGARELSVAAVAFNQLGLLYDRLGRRTDAIAAHYQSARLQPGAWEPRRNLGFAYLRAGQWEAAAAELAETLRLDATREPALTGVAARAYLEAGRACLERGDLAGASSAFAKAIQHRPTLAAAYHYLAYAQSAAGAWDAAAETLRDAAAAVPGDPLIAENQARVARGELPALPS
jgi:tetratricopeptide (TPR) repeat protein